MVVQVYKTCLNYYKISSLQCYIFFQDCAQGLKKTFLKFVQSQV
jgi:hypothetical protein